MNQNSNRKDRNMSQNHSVLGEKLKADVNPVKIFDAKMDDLGQIST